jgi:hypothetical protein
MAKWQMANGAKNAKGKAGNYRVKAATERQERQVTIWVWHLPFGICH